MKLATMVGAVEREAMVSDMVEELYEEMGAEMGEAAFLAAWEANGMGAWMRDLAVARLGLTEVSRAA